MIKLYATLLLLLLQLPSAYCQSYNKEDLYGYYRIINGCNDSLGNYENTLYLNKNGYEWKADENRHSDGTLLNQIAYTSNDLRVPLRLIYKGNFEVNNKTIYLRTKDSAIVAQLEVEDSLNLKLISLNKTAMKEGCYFNRYERHFYNDKAELSQQWFIKRSIRKIGRQIITDPYYIFITGTTQMILPLSIYK